MRLIGGYSNQMWYIWKKMALKYGKYVDLDLQNQMKLFSGIKQLVKTFSFSAKMVLVWSTTDFWVFWVILLPRMFISSRKPSYVFTQRKKNVYLIVNITLKYKHTEIETFSLLSFHSFLGGLLGDFVLFCFCFLFFCLFVCLFVCTAMKVNYL